MPFSLGFWANFPSGAFTAGTMPMTAGGVIYGDKWVAVNETGTAGAYSTNGTTWTSMTMPANGLDALAWNGSLYVATARKSASNNTNAASSTDGITWTLRTLPDSKQWQDLTYTGSYFIAVNNTSTGNRGARSSNGTTWSAASPGSSADGYEHVGYGNGKVIAMDGNNATATARVSTDNGATWSNLTLPATGSWDKPVYGNSTWLIKPTGSSGLSYTSPDAVTWTARSSLNTCVVIYGDKFFKVRTSADSVQTSTDAITWTDVPNVPADLSTLALSSSDSAIAYGNNAYMIVGPDSTTSYLFEG